MEHLHQDRCDLHVDVRREAHRDDRVLVHQEDDRVRLRGEILLTLHDQAGELSEWEQSEDDSRMPQQRVA